MLLESRLTILLTFCVVVCSACQTARPGALPASEGPAVFVEVEQARTLIADGAVVLDVRGAFDYRLGHIPGAERIDWGTYTDGVLNGELAHIDRARSDLEAAGVGDDRAVIVVGNWNEGWGEEGRVFWMLRTLGHDESHILHGGMVAWEAAGGDTDVFGGSPTPGTMSQRPRFGWITTAELAQGIEDKKVAVIDARRREEYDGETPYFADRGGHIPTAIHFHWKRVFTPDGALRSPESIRADLAAAGVNYETQQTVAYCTGGVRSAFLWAVLIWAGVDAVNYDGSWWAWAADESLPIE